MCKNHNIQRQPVKVIRKPITWFKENNIGNGGWCPFPKPDQTPPMMRTRRSERVLWCPWCDEWTIFKKDGQGDRWNCKGVCGWANTDEFYVRSVNNIWFENVPLSELKKLSIPAPAKSRK